jgi:sugar (pentulose or hexulose) kinase
VQVAEVPLARQTPGAWIDALREALTQIGPPHRGVLIAVCGTAGSLVLVDERGAVLGSPMMYNDAIVETGVEAGIGGAPWPASEIAANDSPLRRLFQTLQKLSTEERAQVRWVVPQSTWLSYTLALPNGAPWHVVAADSTNCHKWEGRLSEPQWPIALFQRLGIVPEILPRVVPSGETIGPALGEIARFWGVEDGTVFHGATDGTAEAMALVGDTFGAIGVMAGSTTSIKAVVPKGVDVGPNAHLADHPASADNAFYTAWISVGENLRRRAVVENISLAALVEMAWAVNENDIPLVPLARLPVVDTWLDTPAALFARGVIESAVWWETFHLDRIERVLARSIPDIHMIGGTTRDPRWLQLRADAYRRPIHVHSAAGALGAILPAALKRGAFDAPQSFLDRYRIGLNCANPKALSVAASRRRDRAQSWLST